MFNVDDFVGNNKFISSSSSLILINGKLPDMPNASLRFVEAVFLKLDKLLHKAVLDFCGLRCPLFAILKERRQVKN